MSPKDPRPFFRRRRYVLPLAVLVLANGLVYVGLTRRLATKQERLARRQAELAARIAEREGELEALSAERRRRAANDELVRRFWTEIVRPRDPGLTEAVAEIDRLAREAGVRRGRTAYEHEELDVGLERVTASFPVEGRYFDLVKFINRLERAPRFYLIEQIGLREGSEPGETLELSCRVSFFLRPEGPETSSDTEVS